MVELSCLFLHGRGLSPLPSTFALFFFLTLFILHLYFDFCSISNSTLEILVTNESCY